MNVTQGAARCTGPCNQGRHPCKCATAQPEEQPMPRFRAEQIERIAFLVVYVAATVITLLDVFVWRNQ